MITVWMIVFIIHAPFGFGNWCCSSIKREIYEITARKTVDIFWNIPTFQCDYHKLNFTGLAEKYGFRQNHDARFTGDIINILYDPGSFPAILKGDNGSFLRNGGLPQKGNLSLHLELFRETVDAVMDNNYSGLAIIDFESWRPIFRQNFGALSPYRELSIAIEQTLHPFWPNYLIEKEARRKFEFYAQQFMEETLHYAKQLRKDATWGFYAYPYCFNMSPSNMRMDCPSDVVKENNRLSWLFKVADNFHPSLYLTENRLTAKDKLDMIEGRIAEANRIRVNLSMYNSAKLYPYFWYKYLDTKNFLSKEDLFNSFMLLSTLEIDGLVIWGSSNDVNNKRKCYELYDYIDNVLGPIIINTFWQYT